MHPSRRVKLRSRTGCSRCRIRHQKCDERKPQCSRCLEASIVVCAYEKPIARSQQIARQAEVTLSTPRINRSVVGGSGLPLLSPPLGQFLSYFVQEASSAISCHESIRHDTCTAVISAASVFPGILYASLLFSALHQTSKTCGAAVREKGQAAHVQVLELRSMTLFLLKSQVQKQSELNQGVIIATALMLATCELRYEPETTAWRGHFEFARHLLLQCQGDNLPSDSALWRFIRRRFIVMEFLVSLPTSWSPLPRRCLSTQPVAMPHVDSIGVIDSTMACCNDLLDIFRWIGALEDTKHRSMAPHQSNIMYAADDSGNIAAKLVAIVLEMMARDSETPPIMSDDLQGPLADGHLEDYRVCNTIAQHVALICLYRYSMGFERTNLRVTNSVSSVIELARATSKHVGLHPSICLTTALFIAGCDADEEQKVDIKQLLELQYQVTKSQNSQRTLDMLLSIWSEVPSRNRVRDERDLFTASFIDFVPY